MKDDLAISFIKNTDDVNINNKMLSLMIYVSFEGSDPCIKIMHFFCNVAIFTPDESLKKPFNCINKVTSLASDLPLNTQTDLCKFTCRSSVATFICKQTVRGLFGIEYLYCVLKHE